MNRFKVSNDVVKFMVVRWWMMNNCQARDETRGENVDSGGGCEG